MITVGNITQRFQKKLQTLICLWSDWVNGFKLVYQQFIAMYDIIVRSAVTVPDSSRVLVCEHI